MIPVPKESIKLLDFNERGEKYRELLQAEIEFINHNKTTIYAKARKMYKNVVISKIQFYINISCNYKLLEKRLLEYSNN